MKHARNPITILFVTYPIPALMPMLWGRGGAEGMPTIYKLVQGLVAAGHEVHYLSIVNPKVQAELGIDKEYLFTSGIHSHLLKVPQGRFLSPLIGDKTSGLFPTLRAIYRAIFCLWRLIGITGKIKPDLIYAGMGYQVLGWLSGRLKRVPTIFRFYGVHTLYDSMGKWSAFSTYPNEVLALKIHGDQVIITNDGSRGDKVARFYGVPEHKLNFWINGVDKTIYQPDFDREGFLNRLGIPPQKRVVLTLCRLANWKRVDRVIRAAPEVVKKINNVVFLIVGDGPERPNLELLAQQLEVSGQVKFVGAIPHDEVSGFMNIADIFVSLHDLANLPVPILEAMACGKCIISLDDGALEGIIENGKSGILIKPELVDSELPDILVDLLSDDSRRQQLGRKAREFAMNNLETWEERIAKEIRLIEEVALGHKLRKK